eukprot:COSAG05_NODE_224_length_13609_cov_26.220429_2_plen_242_part_00
MASHLGGSRRPAVRRGSPPLCGASEAFNKNFYILKVYTQNGPPAYVRFVSQRAGSRSPRHGSHAGRQPLIQPTCTHGIDRLGTGRGCPLGLQKPPQSSGSQWLPPQCEELKRCRRASSSSTTCGFCAATSCSSYMSDTTSNSIVPPARYVEEGGVAHGARAVTCSPQPRSGGGRGSSYLPSARGGGVQPYGHHGCDSFGGEGSAGCPGVGIPARATQPEHLKLLQLTGVALAFSGRSHPPT